MTSPNFKLMISLWLLACLFGLASAQLNPNFYALSCPLAVVTIKTQVTLAVLGEPRMAASLLRLHFHDCFVQGCDASVLLNDTDTFIGEKTAFPNLNSLRGFEVIDNIKSVIEALCPGVVSCADIVAVAARDSVVAVGGPSWTVGLGRRDSTTASFDGANSDLPAPFLNLDGLITAFANKGFTATEMVALSGAHTIGKARCVTFRSRIYNDTNIDPSFAASLQAICPFTDGNDNLAPLDTTTQNLFDNNYYSNLVVKTGLLHSDQELFNGGSTDSQVQNYVTHPLTFRADFANAMVKMSNLSPLTGQNGQIRTKCYQVNQININK